MGVDLHHQGGTINAYAQYSLVLSKWSMRRSATLYAVALYASVGVTSSKLVPTVYLGALMMIKGRVNSSPNHTRYNPTDLAWSRMSRLMLLTSFAACTAPLELLKSLGACSRTAAMRTCETGRLDGRIGARCGALKHPRNDVPAPNGVCTAALPVAGGIVLRIAAADYLECTWNVTRRPR